MKGLPFKSITTKKIQKKPASALLAQLSKHYPSCYNHIHFRVHREQCTIFQHKYAVDEQDMTFNHTLHFCVEPQFNHHYTQIYIGEKKFKRQISNKNKLSMKKQVMC